MTEWKATAVTMDQQEVRELALAARERMGRVASRDADLDDLALAATTGVLDRLGPLLDRALPPSASRGMCVRVIRDWLLAAEANSTRTLAEFARGLVDAVEEALPSDMSLGAPNEVSGRPPKLFVLAANRRDAYETAVTERLRQYAWTYLSDPQVLRGYAGARVLAVPGWESRFTEAVVSELRETMVSLGAEFVTDLDPWRRSP